jgi:hypothetical protein
MRTVRRGYTVESHAECPSWAPVPVTCGHVHGTLEAAARCSKAPFGQDPRPVRAILAEGRVVTVGGIAAPPLPKVPAHCYQPVHPASLPLDADDRAHLYPDGGDLRVAVAEFSRWSATGFAFVRIAEGPDVGLELCLADKPPADRVEVVYQPGGLVAELRTAA